MQTHCNLILVVEIFCSHKNHVLSNFTSVLQLVDMCPCMYVNRLLQLSYYSHIKVQTDISKSFTLKVFTVQCVQNSSIKIGTNCTFVNTDEISLAHVALLECFGQPQPSSGKVHVTWKVTVGLLHNVLICTKDADIQRNTNY